MELLLLKRRPNIDEIRDSNVLHILLCRAFETEPVAWIERLARITDKRRSAGGSSEIYLISKSKAWELFERETQHIVFGLASKLAAVEISVNALIWAWKLFTRWFSSFLSKSVCVRTVQGQLAYSWHKLNRSSLMKWMRTLYSFSLHAFWSTMTRHFCTGSDGMPKNRQRSWENLKLWRLTVTH